MDASFILLIFFMILTLAVMVCGIVVMARGGEVNRRFGNKLMVLRVTFQALALAALALMFAA